METGRKGEGKKEKEATISITFARAPVDATVIKNQGATLTGKPEG